MSVLQKNVAAPSQGKEDVSAMDANALKSRLNESEAQMTAFMRQVTTDFEELTWLRSLASYVDLCDVRHKIVDVAAIVLPSLCDLIGAELLVLYAGAPVYTIGNLQLPSSVLDELVKQFATACTSRPIVRNLGFGKGVSGSTSDVRNVIVMQ